ncbi:MAG: glycosyltransferase [Sphingobacteriales bacterium]|nr:glycosyltransferase [Sphingobacteriales bacterium]
MTLVQLLKILFILLQLIVAVYLLVPFTALLFRGIRQLLRARNKIDKKPVLYGKDFTFYFIVTAHEETAFIPPLLDSIRRQTYGNQLTYIVADCCDPSANFDDGKTITLYPATPLNSKIRSIEYAMAAFRSIPDAVIILDADNLIHPGFLSEMNTFFKKGYQVVQANFKAKNTDTPFARMDSMGDLFNFFVEREMRMEAGLSSAIWGAGIAFDYKLYQGIRYKDYLGGFDKKLQVHLASQVKQIAFAKDAVLYDEKISDGKALEKQRTRWISSQFKYQMENVRFLLKALKELNMNRVYFGFINIRPPLFILLALALVFMTANIFLSVYTSIAWALLLFLFLFSFISIIRIQSKDNRYLKTLLNIPQFIFRQVVAAVKIKKASKSFLKTTHTQVIYISDILEKKTTSR